MDIVSLEGLSGIIPIILTIIGLLVASWEKISKTKFFIKVRTEAHNYYLLGRERKFLIVSFLCAVIAISSITIGTYSYFFIPHQNNEVYFNYRPINLIGSANVAVLNVVFGREAILIDKNQIFVWGRGWNENTKLKKITLNYSTQGTVVRILGLSNQTDYSLNGNSALNIGDISINYSKGVTYGMSITNIGDAPFYLFGIETEEEYPQPESLQRILPFFIGIYGLIFMYFFYKKDKNRKATAKPLDLLYEDAKYADKIKNIEIELETYQNMLKYLEVLKQKNEVSEMYYINKKNLFEDYLKKLNDEKDTIESEIEDIKKSLKINELR